MVGGTDCCTKTVPTVAESPLLVVEMRMVR